MKLETTSFIVGFLLIGMLGGCAAVPPAQLVKARDAYTVSSSGMTAQLSPTELYDAKKVLDQANQEFSQRGDTAAVRDYSYIATRKIELAVSREQLKDERRTSGEALKDERRASDDQLREERVTSREQLGDERRASTVATAVLQETNTAQREQLEQTTTKLDSERMGRNYAEMRLADAMKELAAVAAVREEPRGVVITLNGSVLFASGRFTLLENAKTKLNQVAEALMDQSDDKRIVVEGHTDSRGTKAVNQLLSLNRANAVLDYLVSRGVDANKISAAGLGSSRPLLDNDNAENRANNRRVEIIIHPAQITTR
jgi:outer membrane protein OmpA-like peptidoglycan-associated protein